MHPWLERAYAELSQRVVAGRLHHGLLFTGEPGSGYMAMQTALSTMILCTRVQAARPCGECHSCQLLQAGTHPDLQVLEKDNSIGIDKIRHAINKLNETSHISGRKVLVINDAHAMTEASANALLKTLEEPTAHTYLLLFSHEPQQLLPTVLSRCERHPLPQPTAEQSLAWLAAEGVDLPDGLLRTLYAREPLMLKRLSEDNLAPRVESLAEAMAVPLLDSLALTDEWLAHTEVFTRVLQHLVRSRLSSMSPRQFASAQQALVQLQRDISKTGVNKGLCMARAVDSLRALWHGSSQSA